MALDPTIPLRGDTYSDARSKVLNNTSQAQANVLNQAKIDNLPFERQRQQTEAAQNDEIYAMKKRASELEEAKKHNDLIYGFLSASNDPQTYTMARQRAAQIGLDVSDTPEQYDPNFVRHAAMTSMSVKDRIDNELETLKTQSIVGANNALAGQRNAASELNQANASKVRAATQSATQPTQIDPQTGQPVFSLIGGSMSADQKRAFDANIKFQQEQGKAGMKSKGQGDVNSILDDLEGQYKQLDQSGAISNPQRGVISNIGASLASSPIGQAVGGVVGTEAQSVRQSIQNSLPLLMASIKNATGMSSQQMNSNAELKFYMQAATDPSRDIQSNLNALKTLRNMFGGEAKQAATTAVNLKEKYGLE